MIKENVRLLFIALLVVLSACTSDKKHLNEPGENYTLVTASVVNKTIFFPRQQKTDGERAVMDGEIDGTLVLVNNCIRINSDQAKESYLLIWPPGFDISVKDSMVEILDSEGQVVAHIGDMVQIGGGEIPLLSMLDKFIQEQIPAQCSARYWVVGDW